MKLGNSLQKSGQAIDRLLLFLEILLEHQKETKYDFKQKPSKRGRK